MRVEWIGNASNRSAAFETLSKDLPFLIVEAVLLIFFMDNSLVNLC